MLPAVGAQRPNHWTTREVPQLSNILMTVSHSSLPPLHHGPLLPNLSAHSFLPPSATRCHKTHNGPLAPPASPLINYPEDIKYPPADTEDPKSECPYQTSTLSHRFLNPSALLTLYLLNVSARMCFQNTNQITPPFCSRPFRMSSLAFSASEPVLSTCSLALSHASPALVDTPGSSLPKDLALSSTSWNVPPVVLHTAGPSHLLSLRPRDSGRKRPSVTSCFLPNGDLLFVALAISCKALSTAHSDSFIVFPSSSSSNCELHPLGQGLVFLVQLHQLRFWKSTQYLAHAQSS